jgi:hypothetical protein
VNLGQAQGEHVEGSQSRCAQVTERNRFKRVWCLEKGGWREGDGQTWTGTIGILVRLRRNCAAAVMIAMDFAPQYRNTRSTFDIDVTMPWHGSDGGGSGGSDSCDGDHRRIEGGSWAVENLVGSQHGTLIASAARAGAAPAAVSGC